MGFQQGLSGLNAASKSLDVIGNNIANANTVGFKMAQTQFADVFANSLSGAGGSSVGIGVKVATIAQQFTQGNISSTNNPLDIAINGAGFFRMSSNGAVTYSRNGQFQLDKNGGIVNAQGSQLTGYIADTNGVLSTGAAVPLTINTADIPPKETDIVNALINLDSRKNVPGTQTPVTIPPVIVPVAFSITDPLSYSNATSVAVFDSLGNSHVLQTFFVKVDPVTRVPPAGTTAQWDVFATVDGVLIAGLGSGAGSPANSIGKIGFNNVGKLTGATTLDPSATPVKPNMLPIAVPVITGAVPLISTPTIDFDLTGSTQFGSDFSVNAIKQDGYTSGKLSKFSTAKDGTIVGSYTNGKTAVLGQVALANFTNPNGLQSSGDNQWTETSTSGPALVGPPSSGSLGVLTSSATEDSNTDLTGELVNMITAQRIYQANAQTIKTQDQVMQTLVNLR
ncbi:MAG: flagellar hook protein FlgE [Undibacterium sp.]|uniref:flagellar hook protein FlgE n=1 Tax=Undibacterium sp. TaxID=1914977 RepID=UPI00271BB447|nr:flagellar hook protein FlgE [Undibacterium sp.]MDO8651518.1 flagellar hook protein FlgE [Undibacterium sp.]